MDNKEMLPEEIDKLLLELRTIKVKKFELEHEENELVRKIDSLAGNLEKTQGVVVLKGKRYEASVDRRINVKYERDVGREHPLAILIKEFPDLYDHVYVKYFESGRKIERLLENTNINPRIREILKGRIVTQGRPDIQVRERRSL